MPQPILQEGAQSDFAIDVAQAYLETWVDSYGIFVDKLRQRAKGRALGPQLAALIYHNKENGRELFKHLLLDEDISDIPLQEDVRRMMLAAVNLCRESCQKQFGERQTAAAIQRMRPVLHHCD